MKVFFSRDGVLFLALVLVLKNAAHFRLCALSEKPNRNQSSWFRERAGPPLSRVSTTQSPLGLGSISYIINHSLIDIWHALSPPRLGNNVQGGKFLRWNLDFCNLKT